MNTTAVEWLLNEMFTNGGLKKEQGVMYISPELVAKAKEMEKQQIIDAWYDGQNDHEREIEMYAFGEEYYNGIIKSEENGK